MDLVPAYIYSVLQSLLWAMSCVGLGFLVGGRLHDASKLERLLVSFLTGCLIWVGIGLILFLFRLFRPGVLIALVYLGGIGSFVLLGRTWLADLKGRPGFDWQVLTLAIILSAQFLYALIPVTAFDALYYHLPLARHMLETGTISWTPWIFNSSFPQSYELLQAIGLATGGDVAASLVSWWFALATVLTLIAIGGRLGNWRIGLWAGIALSLTPLWFWLAHVPYMECGQAFGIVLLILLTLMNGPGWAVGMAAGWLACCKYWGIEAGLLGLVIWFIQTRPGGRQAIIALLTAIAVAVFWYARNLYLFSNPFFPYYLDLFSFLGSPRVEGALETTYQVIRKEASPTDLEGWLRLPVRLMVNPVPDYADYAARTWKYVGWLAAVWPFAIIPAIRKHRPMLGMYFFTLIAVFSWIVIHGVTYLRYLTPLMPLMYILALMFLADLFSKVRIKGIEGRHAIAFACLLAIAHLIGATTDRGLVQIPLNFDEREIFLEANIDGWAFIRELNEVEPEPVVYFLYGEGVRHYCDFTLYAGWNNPYDFGEFRRHSSSGAELADWLEEIGVDVLLINERRVRQLQDDTLDILMERNFISRYPPAVVSYQDTTMFVYYEEDIL